MTDLDSELQRLRAEGLVLPKDRRRAVKSYAETVQTVRSMHEWAGRDLEGIQAKMGRTVRSDDLHSPQVRAIKEENDALARAMAERRGISYAGQRGVDGRQRVAARRAAQDARWGKPDPARFVGTGPGDMHRTSSRGTMGMGGMQKEAVIGGGGTTVGGDVMNALPRFYDPLEYWDLSGLPWNVADEGHRHKLHKWLRLYYATHYLVPILVDIFTRFPLVGMELEHEDKKLKGIYEDLFLDQLQYEDFLVALGREVWLVGEAFPLGSFDEELGIWEHEELINPEDVVIDNFPLLDSQQLKIVPPDYLRRIAQTKQPAREWYMLQQNYADLVPYLLKGEHIPMSPVVLRQVANKMNNWDDHGTPILLRGLRTLLHEEKLLASQDAIAERLYSPFILAKLGIQDMGDGLPPWLPTPDELQSVRDDIDIAMASDFRVLVHHFGLELESVFGREQMPRLGDDFDRIERRLMQVFGVNPSLLSAGSNAQPYASSALQAEFMNQILRTFQKQLKEHFRARAAVVAEAQGHYAYERKGQTRVPIYENVVEWDEEGNKSIVRKRKYTFPELDFATFDLRDEATERQFLTGLRAVGIPIPDEKMMIGISWKDQDYTKIFNDEIKKKTIDQQQAKMDTYIALVIKGLPVPIDLKAEVESVLAGGTGASQLPGEAGGAGGPGGPPPGGAPGGPDGGGGTMMPPPPPGLLGPGPGAQPPGGGAPPTAPNSPQRGTVPEASNERRPGLTYNAAQERVAASLAQLAGREVEMPAIWQERTVAVWRELNDIPEDGPQDAKVAAHVEESTETGDPDTWILTSNQQIVEEDGEPVILEGKKSRMAFEFKEPRKRYQLIDPLATPTEDADN